LLQRFFWQSRVATFLGQFFLCSFFQGALDIRAPEFPGAMPEYHDGQNPSVDHIPD
jgi:hypothetical protein